MKMLILRAEPHDSIFWQMRTRILCRVISAWLTENLPSEYSNKSAECNEISSFKGVFNINFIFVLFLVGEGSVIWYLSMLYAICNRHRYTMNQNPAGHWIKIITLGVLK